MKLPIAVSLFILSWHNKIPVGSQPLISVVYITRKWKTTTVVKITQFIRSLRYLPANPSSVTNFHVSDSNWEVTRQDAEQMGVKLSQDGEGRQKKCWERGLGELQWEGKLLQGFIFLHIIAFLLLKNLMFLKVTRFQFFSSYINKCKTRDGRRLRIKARAQTGHWLYGWENLP